MRDLPHIGSVVAAMFVPGRDLLVGAERHYPDGKWMAFGSAKTWFGCGTQKTWEESRGTLQRHNDLIQSLDVSPDGTLIATGSDDCTVAVWDLTENRLRHRMLYAPAATGTNCVAFTNQQRVLATAGGDGAVGCGTRTMAR